MKPPKRPERRPTGLVLVIDDDTEMRELLHAWIAAWGYRVAAATGAVEGLRLSRTLDPDLILLNLQMPAINGDVMCGSLRSDPRTNKLKIILYSGSPGIDEVSAAAGADDCLRAPFEPERLKAAIERQVRR